MTPIQTMHYEGPTPQNYSKLPYWDVLLVLRINGFYHRWILQINQLTNDRSNHFQPDAQKVDLHDTGFPHNECALLTITMQKTPSYLPAPKKTPKPTHQSRQNFEARRASTPFFGELWELQTKHGKLRGFSNRNFEADKRSCGSLVAWGAPSGEGPGPQKKQAGKW